MSNGAFKSIKVIVISVILIVFIFFLLFQWRVSRNSHPPMLAAHPISVAAIKIQSHSLSDEIEAIGSLQAVQEVLLSPDTAGRITHIYFEAGQEVEQGSLLLELFDAPEQADLAAAHAKEHFAQLQFKRSQDLATSGAESQELFEHRQAEVEQAVAEVQQIKARIKQKAIQAPFAGQIGIRRVDPGQYLNAGDGIATLTQLDQLFVNFTLPQQDLSKLTDNVLVEVTVDAVPGKVFSAQITTIEPRVNEDTRNIKVQALLPNADRILKSGMYVTVRLVLPAVSDVIALPLTAIQTSASGDSVILVQDVDGQGIGKIVAVPVKSGRQIGENVVVLQGVKSGDIVVTAGQNRLPPGAVVQVNPDAVSAASSGQ
ncbi:efflux RND transporter periplasmic adaptor subunit [Shewanella vesiculosa]|uniref:efflux RND transporter periplasmic adaptor subunit n=1 Tax=Shewanella vesiculosa TaxID=518738 RepID=UPI00384F3500